MDSAEDRTVASTGSESKSVDKDNSGQPGETDAGVFGSERILLLVADGPVVVELKLTIDGRPHALALDEVVENVFKRMDSDGDGKVTWEDVVNDPQFRYGQAGNLETKEQGDKQRMIRLYDSNRDGLVDREELPRFVTRNSGGSRPFSFTNSNLFRGVNRTQSAVRRWLDADEDGSISGDELRTAAERLRGRDDDDDDLLVLANFKQVPNAGDGNLPNRRRVSETDSGFALNAQTKWDILNYAVREQYAAGGNLQPDHFGPFTATFDHLDENRNKRIDKSEISRWLTLEPNITVWASFGDRAQVKKEQLSVALAGPLLQGTRAHRHGARLTLQLPKSRVEFFINDELASDTEEAQAMALFTRFDSDKNGYLDEKEFPAQESPMAPTLSAVDADGDKKVFLEELRTYFKQRAAPSRSQIRVRTADAEDAFFSALDEDGDGRLISREIYGSEARLLTFDHDGDSAIHSHEVPDCIIVGLARGASEREAALFAPPPIPPATPAAGIPKWFTSMDVNEDGEVHRLEFLGTSDKFDALDKNADGFLTATEVTSALTDRTE